MAGWGFPLSVLILSFLIFSGHAGVHSKKPDPITETEKNSKQLEFNFDFNQDQPLLVELNK